MIRKTQLAATVAISIAFIPLCACGTNSSSVETSSYETEHFGNDLNTLELERLCQLALDDMDKLPTTDRTSEYLLYVCDVSDLIYSSEATQEEVDEAVKTLSEMREDVLANPYSSRDRSLPVIGIDEPLPPYAEVVANPDAYVGKYFAISGRVKHENNSALTEKLGDRTFWAYVFWDENETDGEIVEIRIPYEMWHGSHKWFDGICMLEGINEDGQPSLLVDEYEP